MERLPQVSEQYRAVMSEWKLLMCPQTHVARFSLVFDAQTLIRFVLPGWAFYEPTSCNLLCLFIIVEPALLRAQERGLPTRRGKFLRIVFLLMSYCTT